MFKSFSKVSDKQSEGTIQNSPFLRRKNHNGDDMVRMGDSPAKSTSPRL